MLAIYAISSTPLRGGESLVLSIERRGCLAISKLHVCSSCMLVIVGYISALCTTSGAKKLEDQEMNPTDKDCS